MDRVRARTPNPYERDKLHRMKRQTTNAVNSRHAPILSGNRFFGNGDLDVGLVRALAESEFGFARASEGLF